MAKETFLPRGLAFTSDTSNSKTSGHFSLTRWFKKQLDRFNVASYDECCPPAEDAGGFIYTGLRQRWDGTLFYTEHYNPNTKAWEEITAFNND